MSLKYVLSKLIHGREDFCSLCFREITVDEGEKYIEGRDIHEMLQYILSEELLDILQTGMVCKYCQSSTVSSFNFIKMCKENSSNLYKCVQSIKKSCESIPDEGYNYNTLFVYLNTSDFGSEPYYDLKTICSQSAAYVRFQKILKAKHKAFNSSPKIVMSSLDKRRTRQFVCNLCGKKYFREYMLKHHMQIHDKLKSRQFMCSQCGKCFSTKQVLKTHEISHKLVLKCSLCGHVYRNNVSFNKHIREKLCQHKTRRSSKQGTFYCNYCKKSFCHKPYLAKHIKYEHENAIGFKCKYCSKQFYTPSLLESHVVKHTLEKKFICQQCGGRFGSNMSLLYHTRLHTGEKPYQCEHCEKAFLSASRRLDHTRRHHMAPSLQCEICLKMFKATNSLLKHRKRHFNPNSKLNSSKCLYPPADL